mmetsp:Transcript_37582/g.42039  ORF Transcript_37582/g.42039 Transcript_37582/m.42039 type:complete len:137 (+) Transcript_37582:297-707(+)|eukprot:CAMPEP_0170878664 /NCGR_PEP_ID=MMETSP0734-20130129/31153_1 /TAXON_ID=186038 /ORGANISM="Fragilariopsis kerguelensis, Strain L26-C5" /LENGTH=136 /DNA_ID=CAMNT_0011261397 /DNA_START=296 /DNA_END=706 /DNA_ORIENTATION=+
MTHRISQKSLPIPDVNVRAMINVPNGTAAQRRKRQKFRTKILKKLSNLRTKDVLEMNSEDLTRLKQIRALMQEFGSRDVFLSSFRDATTIGHELSIAKKILDIIDSYPNKYVPFQIAKATKLFNTSMIIYDKKLSK